MRNGVEGEDGHGFAGEECYLKGSAGGVGDHIVRVIGAAECVFMFELLLGGNVEPVDGGQYGGACIGVKERADFFGLEAADGCDDVGSESDGEFCFGESDVAGDAFGGVAGGLPVAAFGLLCDGVQ